MSAVSTTDKLTEVLAAHQIPTAWHGQHDGWWECTCQGGEFAIAWTPEHLAQMIADAGLVVIELPEVAHKGPHDTDAKFFRQVAERMDDPFHRIDYVGGGNVRRAVQQLLRRAADSLDGGAR